MPTLHGGRPAVNIKCYKGIFDAPFPLDLGKFSEDGGKTWEEVKVDPAYTPQWIEDNICNQDLENYRSIVADDVLVILVYEAKELFQEAGYDVEIDSAGRSGGWLEVHGLDEIENWSEDLVEVWKTLETRCEDAVENFPAALATEIYYNVFEGQKAEKAEKEEQIKAIWDEVKDFIFGRTGNADARNTALLLEEFFKYCPLLTAQVEAIKK